MDKTLHLGIDVAMAETTCYPLLDDGTEARCCFTVANNLPGAEQLVKKIVVLMERYGLNCLLIGLEATNLYWYHLACFLISCPELAPFQPRVHAFNPRLVRAFKKALADTGKVTRGKNYFLYLLFLKFSEYQNLDPFSDTFGATSQAVLTDYLTVDEIVAAPLEELASLLAKESKNHFPSPDAIAAAVKRAARDSYPPHLSLNEPLNLILGATLENIRTLSQQVKKIDQAIEREVRKFPNPLGSIPGLGPFFVAGILAEIRDIHRFPDHSSLAKFDGLFWRARESSSFQAEETLLDKSGNAYLRYYVIEAANSVWMHSAEYGRYYRIKYDESTKHKHKRALVLTARKLVRLADGMLRRNQLYISPPLNLSEEVSKQGSTKTRPAKQHRYRQPGSHSLALCA